jgi:hypothetical protein
LRLKVLVSHADRSGGKDAGVRPVEGWRDQDVGELLLDTAAVGRGKKVSVSDPEDKSQLDAGQSRILDLLRKMLLWNWLRGRRGKPRQAGAMVSYVFVALVIVGAAMGPASPNKTSSKAAAAPTQSPSSAPTVTTAVSTTTTSATSTPEPTPKKRPTKKPTVLTRRRHAPVEMRSVRKDLVAASDQIIVDPPL